MRTGSLSASNKPRAPFGVIIASAGHMPPAAQAAFDTANAAATRNPAPLSVRDNFGADPDLTGYEVYVHRDVTAGWALLLISPNGSGAEMLSGVLRRTCIQAAAWMAQQGAAVTIMGRSGALQ